MVSPLLVDQYRVRLPIFEGPLDLLIFFIKRDEIDIYDIPIAKITQDFLDYLNLLSALDLVLAGDFMVIAATLMRIKAKMLLPPVPGEEEEDIEDPRRELVEMLIEYKRFKEAAGELRDIEEDQIKMFPRIQSMEEVYGGPTVEDSLTDVTLYDLLETVKRILADMPEEMTHDVETISNTIEEQMGVIESFFGERKEYTFKELAKTFKKRVVVILTFLALLELMRSTRITISQDKFLGEILIRKVSNEK
ncbi:MAG: segregation/condensation protein A [Candidatus Marinimicrobia bacterium]|nr:segregation/condensation protein A [Candidatus Neomarinimicrobiota bacterium]